MDIEKLLAEMSLEEKLGQLSQSNAVVFKSDNEADVTGPNAEANGDGEAAETGSTLNFIGAQAMLEIQKRYIQRQKHHIPLLFMQDVIHGYRTIFPIPLAMGCSFDPSLMEACTAMSAKEAAVSGVHVTFAPMLDLVRDARWGRVMESTGEDPVLNARLGVAAVRGFRGKDSKDPYRLATCVKHFAAYGAPEGGRDYNAVELSDNALRGTYLPAYRAAVEAGAEMVMPSFNTVGGVPSTCNRYLLTDILRKEWGFDGIVISDYNAYNELIKHGVAEDGKDAAEQAVNAGCDVEMVSRDVYRYGAELISQGKITQEQIDESVRRVLRLKEEMGLFDNPYRSADPAAEEKIHLCPEHRALAQKAAEECAVLLQNNGVLPFSEQVKKIAVVGPFADEKGIKGFWACAGRDEDCVTVADGIRRLLPSAEVTVASGCSRELMSEDVSGVDEAVRAAAQADAVVLCLGEYQKCSGEGNSRADLTLSPAQTALFKAVLAVNPNSAVLIFCGRPLVLTDLCAEAPAVLCMWQPGTEGGTAAADLLFGKANPCGKLSMSFPYCVGQVPVCYSHLNTGRPVKNPKEITEKTYCSRYQDAPCDPLFVFGHGLSYNRYTYGNLELDRNILRPGEAIRVAVTVKNEGNYDGKETVQLYVRDLVGSVARPVLELKDFCKTEFRPGEEKTVIFSLTEEQLRFETRSNGYASEPGRFRVFVGPDSDHLLSAEFVLEK